MIIIIITVDMHFPIQMLVTETTVWVKLLFLFIKDEFRNQIVIRKQSSKSIKRIYIRCKHDACFMYHHARLSTTVYPNESIQTNDSLKSHAIKNYQLQVQLR